MAKEQTKRQDRGKSRLQLHPKGPNQNQARGELEAGQEGHHEHLGKAGVSEEELNVVPPPELTQVPPLPILLLAGLA